MPSQKDKTADRSGSELLVRPFEVAAIATALWINDSNQASDNLDGFRKSKRPKDFIDDAHELLTAARQVLGEELVQNEKRRAADERRKVEGQFDPNQTFTFKEALEVQRQKTEDATAMEGSLAKFFPGKKWEHLKSSVESGRFHFTNKDLANRPLGFSMVGTITTLKGLRAAINRLFPENVTMILRGKSLSMFQIERILIDQLNRNGGKIPKPRAKSTQVAG